MSEPPPTATSAPDAPPPAPRKGLAPALPFVLTAVAAVCLSLALQALLPLRQPGATAPTAPSATATLASAPTSIAPASTAPATPPPAEGVLRLNLLDLQEQDRQLWSALYLLRAAAQIDDAVVALQVNDPDEADRTLLTAYRSLDRAYTFSAEQEKGPLDAFRLQISQVRDDLHLRPEGADRRLRQIRRLVLSLVDEGG